MNVQPIEFDHLRDYETATSRALKAEYVFAIVNGPPGEGEEVAAGVMPSMRSRGAFFTPLSDVSTLRKRRYRVSLFAPLLMCLTDAVRLRPAKRELQGVPGRNGRRGKDVLGWNGSSARGIGQYHARGSSCT